MTNIITQKIENVYSLMQLGESNFLLVIIRDIWFPTVCLNIQFYLNLKKLLFLLTQPVTGK